jgi:hypothetical protein
MAYVQKWNPLDDQTETTGQTNGIDPNAQKQGTFNNLQKYLDANQGGAQSLGTQVAGNINSVTDAAQNALTTSSNEFANKVSTGTNIFNPDAADPSKTQKSTYTGPTSWASSDQGTTALNSLNAANTEADRASTVGGRTQMIGDISNKDTSTGALNLDQFLMQNTMPAYNQVATAANNVAPLNTTFNTASTTNQALVTDAQKQVADKQAALSKLIDQQNVDKAAAKTAEDAAAAQAVIDNNAATQQAATDAFLAQLAASNANQQTQFDQQQTTANTANETAYQKMVDLLASYNAANPTTTVTPPVVTEPPVTTPPVVTPDSELVLMADGRRYDPATGIITGPSSSGTPVTTPTQGEGGIGPGESVGPAGGNTSSGETSGLGATSGIAGALGINGVSTTGIGSTIGDAMTGAVVGDGISTGATIGGTIGGAIAGPIGSIVGSAIGQAISNSMATNGQPGAVGPAGPSGAATADGNIGENAAAANAAATNAANAADSAEAVAANSDANAAAAAEGMAPTSGLDAAGAVSAAPASTSDNVGLSSGNAGDNASASVSASPGDAPGDSPGSVSVGASEGQSGSVSEGGGEGGGGGKIICTAMNDLYGLPYTENKVWIKYAVTHLKPEHQVGYHRVFLPLVDYAYKQGNGWSHLQVRKMLEYIAVNRTIDIQAELMGKYRRPVHKLLRNIIEPVLYWIGKRK